VVLTAQIISTNEKKDVSPVFILMWNSTTTGDPSDVIRLVTGWLLNIKLSNGMRGGPPPLIMVFKGRDHAASASFRSGGNCLMNKIVLI
jgi:hypothetical protein